MPAVVAASVAALMVALIPSMKHSGQRATEEVPVTEQQHCRFCGLPLSADDDAEARWHAVCVESSSGDQTVNTGFTAEKAYQKARSRGPTSSGG